MVLSTFLLFLGVAGSAQTDSAKPQSRTEIVIEKQDNGKAVAMSPQHVFSTGDLIRIRFKTNSDGFLYVVNRDTQNKLTALFPREETGRDNRVRAGTEYVIPATTDGWFRIQGAPGYDTTYFVLSQSDISVQAKAVAPESAGAGSSKTPVTPNTMKPRCDDTLFRARGECMDSDSGVRSLSSAEKLPSGVPGKNKLASRDLTFIRQAESTVVLSNFSADGYVVYEFRIAHQ